MGSDILIGGDGDDRLYGDYENSTFSNYYNVPTNDILDGGHGNDLLVGGGADDIYIFGRGYDEDIIDDRHRTYGYDNYRSGGNLDSIHFIDSIKPDEIIVKQSDSNYNLEFRIKGATDKITVLNFFGHSNSLGMGAIEQVRFGNGTVWGIDTILSKMRLNSINESNTSTAYSQASQLIQTMASFGHDNDTTYGQILTKQIQPDHQDYWVIPTN